MTKITLLASAALAVGGAALADTSDKRIALSNNYAGNSWRQAMLTSWDKVTRPAVEQGVVAAADAFTTAENQATEQAAQIQNMILQGYDAIVLNAASPDGAQRRGQGGLRRRHHRRLVRRHRHRALRLAHRGRLQADGQGRGALPRREDARGRQAPRDPRPRRRLRRRRDLARASTRASPRTRSSRSSARCTATGRRTWRRRRSPASCRACPEIVAVVTQGGDGYGAAQAFAAAGRPMPLIIMGNRQDELAWWKEQKDANGYETMSVSIAPGVSTLAFWVAQQILDGKEVPKDLVVPFLRIDQDNLEENLARHPGGRRGQRRVHARGRQEVIEAPAGASSSRA